MTGREARSMTWRELFERGDEYEVTVEDVTAALEERRDAR